MAAGYFQNNEVIKRLFYLVIECNWEYYFGDIKKQLYDNIIYLLNWNFMIMIVAYYV